VYGPRGFLINQLIKQDKLSAAVVAAEVEGSSYGGYKLSVGVDCKPLSGGVMKDRNPTTELDFGKLLGFKRLAQETHDGAALGAALNKAGGEVPPSPPSLKLGAMFNKLGEGPA
jgi:hypothetical protein